MQDTCGTITLRPYQSSAVQAVHDYLCKKTDNPCVCLPCASGKSVVMAALIRKWKQSMPWMRACILAHRKELVTQNAEKMVAVAPDFDIGMFSASIGRRDWYSSVLYASIDSIYQHAGKFTPWNVIFVDEAHRIPASGEGKYRRYISECRRFNAKLRVVGFTATPFRMDCGQICHRDHILNEICYNANIRDLIAEGYLCNLRSKSGVVQPDLSNVKKATRGDYILKELSGAVSHKKLVIDAVDEAIAFINAENRQHVVVYCVDIAHCDMVRQAFAARGVQAVMVTGKTRSDDRDSIVAAFKRGKIRVLCNVQVFTEGFDSPNVDCVILLRPTQSKGLYSQMVGRGLRLDDDKSYCLILDFGRCIEAHGPIDLLDGPYVALATCQNCRETFSRAVRRCPACGWEIPRREVEALEQSERERRMHDGKPSNRSILSDEPEIHPVDEVFVTRHRKEGKPDSVCLTFRCGLKMFRYWLPLDHGGQPEWIAQAWYRKFFPDHKRQRVSVDHVLGDLLFPQEAKEAIRSVTVVRQKKYDQVVGFNQ